MIEMMKYEVVWAKYNTWGNQDEKFHGKSILVLVISLQEICIIHSNKVTGKQMKLLEMNEVVDKDIGSVSNPLIMK